MHGETSATPNSVGTATQTPTHSHHHTSALFHHEPRQHKPRNVNLVHEAEKAASGFNQKIAIGLTKAVGTMVCAYVFAVLAIVGYPGFNATPTQWVQWISQTFIQLVMLSVIMVGQSVLGRKQELQAEEQFNTTVSTYHDIEQIMQHLVAQDSEILRQSKMITHLLEKNGISLEQLEAEVGHHSHLESYTETLSSENPATPAPAENEQSQA